MAHSSLCSPTGAGAACTGCDAHRTRVRDPGIARPA